MEVERRDRLSRQGPALVLVALALALVGPALRPGVVALPLDLLGDFGAWKPDQHRPVSVSNRVVSDAVLQFLPWDDVAARALWKGEVPWTNPFAGDGRPILSNPQTALLSPFTWPRLLLGPEGWEISILLKLLVSAAGAFALTRELGGGRLAATVAGAAFACSGFTTVWLLSTPTNVSAFLPWLATFALRALAPPSPRALLGLAASAALATAGGHPETLFLGVFGIAVLSAWELAGLDAPLRRPRALPAAGAALGGFLLLSPVLIPFLLALPSTRSHAARLAAPAPGLRLAAVGAQLLPGALGTPLAGELDLSELVPGAENFAERTGGYAGGVLLLLLGLGFGGLPERARRAALVGLGALLVAWRPPVLDGLVRLLPLFSTAANERLVVVFAVLGTASGAMAIEAVANGRRRRVAGVVSLVAGAALLVAGALPSLRAGRSLTTVVAEKGIDLLQERGRLTRPRAVYEARLERTLEQGRRTALRRYALPGVCWCAAGIALWGLASRRARCTLLTAAAAGELLGFSAGFVPAVSRAAVPEAPPLVQELRRRDPGRGYSLAATAGVLPPDLATLYGLRDVRTYDALDSLARARSLEAAGYSHETLAFPSPMSGPQRDQLARLGVRFVLSRAEVPEAPRVAGDAPPGVGLYELGDAVRVPVRPDVPPPGFALGLVGLCFGAGLVAALPLLARRSLPQACPVTRGSTRTPGSA